MSTSIPYTIRRHPRSTHVRITIKPDAQVVVTAPARVSLRCIEAFVTEQQPWIQAELKKLHERSSAWELPPDITQDTYQASKHRARKFIHERLRYYNEHYEYSYNRVSVKQMSSRWGSCSSEGNLSFHYRLLFLPLALADYVIVHELCHLAEMNHSHRFWQLVRETVPEYRKHKRALERYTI